MDHQEVVRLQAAEKYVLGDLPTGVRDEFEEHYFDCAECAKDLNALATFVTASREILEERQGFSRIPARESKGVERTGGLGWFDWLKPVIAVPAMTALAAIIVYQNAVVIPAITKQTVGQGKTQVITSSFRLQGTTRGETTVKVVVPAHETFELNFDFTPSQIAPSYGGRLLDPGDKEVLAFALNREQINKEVHLIVPGNKVRTGNYKLVFAADKGSSDQEAKMMEVQHISFAVETQLQ